MKRVEGESAAPPKPRRRYTPGPWVVAKMVQDNLAQVCVHKGAEQYSICDLWGDVFGENDTDLTREQKANARLIAAAPELLAELEHAHDMIKHYLKAGYLPHMSAEEAEQLVRNPDSAILRAREGG